MVSNLIKSRDLNSKEEKEIIPNCKEEKVNLNKQPMKVIHLQPLLIMSNIILQAKEIIHPGEHQDQTHLKESKLLMYIHLTEEPLTQEKPRRKRKR